MPAERRAAQTPLCYEKFPVDHARLSWAHSRETAEVKQPCGGFLVLAFF